MKEIKIKENGFEFHIKEAKDNSNLEKVKISFIFRITHIQSKIEAFGYMYYKCDEKITLKQFINEGTLDEDQELYRLPIPFSIPDPYDWEDISDGVKDMKEHLQWLETLESLVRFYGDNTLEVQKEGEEDWNMETFIDITRIWDKFKKMIDEY